MLLISVSRQFKKQTHVLRIWLKNIYIVFLFKALLGR